MIHPSVHDDGRTVGGENDLYVGIKLENEVDELFLPFHMHTHFGLVHKQDVGLVVLDQHGEKDRQYLFLSTRQLIGEQFLAHLLKIDFILTPHNFLSRVCEQAVHDVLEPAFGLADVFGFLLCVGVATLENT